MSSTVAAVAVTTFLASAVEAIEMVAIVAGVGATRGWRSSLAGAAAGLAVLIVLVVVFGLALTAIPIQLLRLVVGVAPFSMAAAFASPMLVGEVRVATTGRGNS